MLEGRQQAIFDERDRKLEQARELQSQNSCRQIFRKVQRFPQQSGTYSESYSGRRGSQGSAGRQPERRCDAVDGSLCWSDSVQAPSKTIPLMALCVKSRGFGGWPPSPRIKDLSLFFNICDGSGNEAIRRIFGGKIAIARCRNFNDLLVAVMLDESAQSISCPAIVINSSQQL